MQTLDVATFSPRPARPVPRPPRRRWPWIAAIVILTSVLGLLTLRPGANRASGPATPPPAPVTVATLAEETITDQEELLGRVDAVESVEVRPRVSGHIDEVRLPAGELVEKGAVLFVIDPRPYRAQCDLATAALARAQARAGNAERVARRGEELFRTHAIASEQAEASAAAEAEARADVLAATATLAQAKLDLEFTEVRAPIAGRVNRAYVTAGNLVASGTTLLTSIVSVGDAYVYADVDEGTLLAFNRLQRAGTMSREKGRVPVEMALSDEETFTHHGYIESAENRVQSGTGSLVLRMVFPNPHGELIPGLYARVHLPVSAPHPALLVTERAIGTDQSQKYVLTVGADRIATYRAVQLGALLDGRRVLRAGVHPGDRVIVNGLQHARPGSPVAPQAESDPALAATR